MKKFNSIPTLFILLILLASGCEEIIDLDNGRLKTKLVVYSVLSEDSLISVNLTASWPMTDPIKNKEIDAEVNLFIDGSFVENLVYVRSEYIEDTVSSYRFLKYKSSIRPEPGRLYRIEVSAPGFVSVNAECQLPVYIPILNIDTAIVRIPEYKHEYFMETRLRFIDPPGLENYYRLVIVSKFGVYHGDSDIKYTGFPVVVYEQPGIMTSDDPLIKGTEEIIIPGERSPEQFKVNEYTLFSDESFEGAEYELYFRLHVGSQLPDIKNFEFRHFDIQLQSLSEDLYLFLKSISSNQIISHAFFNEPVIVQTNIENGLGVFSAYTKSVENIQIGRYPINGVNYFHPGE